MSTTGDFPSTAVSKPTLPEAIKRHVFNQRHRPIKNLYFLNM